MSQQRQFEGPDVRLLLDEICATYGPEPTIAKAESFRTGGVLGFFQKEHYRLVVEAEQTAQAYADTQLKEESLIYQAPTRRDGKPSRGRHFAGAVRGTADAFYSEMDDETTPTGEIAALSAYGAMSDPDLALDDPFASLADDTDDTFVGITSWLEEPSEAPVSIPAAPVTEPETPSAVDEASFESVLRRVADFVDGPKAVPVTWPSARVEEVPAPAPVVPASEPTPPAPDMPAPAAAVGADLFTDGPTPEPPTPTEAPADPGDRIAGPAVELYQADTEADPELQESLPLPRLNADEVSLRLALHRVGFELEMVERIEAATAHSNLETALVEVFESLTPPPRLPRRGGSIIVVVGSGRYAAVEARRIAEEVGTDPTGIAYATERRLPWPVSEELIIRSVEDAQEIAPGHRRGRVGIIAIDAPVGSVGTTWASSIIHAVRPTLVVGVVDAMYKNEDISDWTEHLGGVDALVLDNVECTVSPARLLSLEIPVTRMDDSPATATRWTATVLDRLLPAHQYDDDIEAVGLHFAGRRPTC